MNKVFELDKQRIVDLEANLVQKGWVMKSVDHAHFHAKSGKNTIVAYLSGKVVFSGEEGVLGKLGLSGNIDSQVDFRLSTPFVSHIGVDESGKGDFFGPLVVAGYYLTKEALDSLVELGVKDSKKITDEKIMLIYEELRKLDFYEEVVISPEKYNDLYREMKNINKVLSWGHANVIEKLLQRFPECKLAVIDQFSKLKSRVSSALLPLAQQIEVVQMHKGEQDIAVAAASIMARGRFIIEMERMSKKFGIDFPKGANGSVVGVGNEFFRKFGNEKLGEVCKLNFKTVNLIGEQLN